MKLWIDTDPGVDDALALLMAFAAPGVDIVGLGITGGNVGLAACTANALKLLDVVDRDVPVHAGAAEPLLPPLTHDAGHVHGRDGFGDAGSRPSARGVADGHAALALIEASHRWPGELTLLTLGPLTNLALALRLDPTLPQRLARWVCMGGAVTAHGNTEYTTSEFNIAFDPEAAAVCFARGPAATLVDWELVTRHGIALAEFEQWLAADAAPSRFYRAISRRTRDFYRTRGMDRFTPADALAMTAVLRPDAITGRAVRPMAIELAGTLTRGQSVVDWRRRNPAGHEVDIVMAMDIDVHRALIRAALGLAPS
jgi:purine nucleosidase